MKTEDRILIVAAFLKGRAWSSPTKIGRECWGEGHHSSSASPLLKRMVPLGIVERNSSGHYRLSPKVIALQEARSANLNAIARGIFREAAQNRKLFREMKALGASHREIASALDVPEGDLHFYET